MCTLYERIMSLCKDKGVSGSRMCLDLGLSKSTLSDMKSGRKKGLSTSNAQKIANYLGVSVDYLINGLYRSEVSSFTNGITVFRGSSQQEIDCRVNALEPGAYRIAFRGPGVVIVVDNESAATDEQISAVIAIYSNQEQTKKAPTVSSERSVSDDDIKFALFGGDGEITDAMYERVKQFAAFIKHEEAEKKKE